jgi:hypothetical protein
MYIFFKYKKETYFKLFITYSHVCVHHIRHTHAHTHTHAQIKSQIRYFFVFSSSFSNRMSRDFILNSIHLLHINIVERSLRACSAFYLYGESSAPKKLSHESERCTRNLLFCKLGFKRKCGGVFANR